MKYGIVTGGDRGIGRAISLKLAMEGVSPIIVYEKNFEAARSTAKEAEKAGVEAIVLKADVGIPEQVRKAVDFVAESVGSVHYLVNNAGGNSKAGYGGHGLRGC